MDQTLQRAPVDLVILDVMMPREDGISICRRLSQRPTPPIVMLSALGDEPDRILGLELGASYYLAKPCSAREVLATVRAALRTRVRFESEAPRRLRLSTRVTWSSLRSSANRVLHVDDRRVQPTSWRH